MAQRSIVWTPTAAFQRRQILKYWTLRNGSSRYSRKLIQLIKSRLEVIVKNPFAYKASSFPDTRISAMGHFSILYKVTNDQLIVTALWDNRQDPAELLKLF
jgi:plasmid stabilization system protein ParE